MKFSKVIVVLVLSLLLYSCFQHYEIYGYKTVEQTFSWGTVRAKLIGKSVTINRFTIKKDPYSLIVSFELKSKAQGIAVINALTLQYKKSKKHIFKACKATYEPIKRHDPGQYKAIFIFDNEIHCAYSNLELLIDYSIEYESINVHNELTLDFIKEFKNYRVIISH